MKHCWVADRNSARTVGEKDPLAGRDGPFDEEVATRIKGNDTASLKGYVFRYVSSPFDLNDFFIDNVSSLKEQRALLGDQDLNLCLVAF
jgi:hypothetical protein